MVTSPGLLALEKVEACCVESAVCTRARARAAACNVYVRCVKEEK